MRSVISVDPIPENDQWIVRLLNVLLDARKSKNYEDLNLNREQFDDSKSTHILIFIYLTC